MDCETCSDLLLDLHYDELDAERAAEVRAHVAACDACRAASERLGLTRTLAARFVLPDAPSASAAVMAALSATVPVPAAASGRVSAVIPIERAREARAAGWLQRVGEVAMRRQVAMAAVFMLMVGLGLRYMPLRSPTQSVTSEMSQPEVVPATDLSPQPAAPSPAVVAQAPTPTMRARAPMARATAPAPAAAPVEGRAANRAAGLEIAAAPRTTWSAGGSGSSVSAADGLAHQDNVGGADSRLQAAATRESETRAGRAETPAAVAPPPPSYGRIPSDEERQAQAALPAAPAPEPSNATIARSSADSAADRGNTNEAIANYQRALNATTAPAEQRDIARRLYQALISAGRTQDAARVQAQYLTPAADPSALAGQVSPSTPRTNTSAATAQPSAPRPTSARPARRSMSNSNVDFNQSAY